MKLMKLFQKLPMISLNIGENVCFFYAVMKVLNSLRNYFPELSTANLKIQALKCLFLELKNSSIAVKITKYLQVLYLNGYIHDQQDDAQERLMQPLQKFYPEVNEQCIVTI